MTQRRRNGHGQWCQCDEMDMDSDANATKWTWTVTPMRRNGHGQWRQCDEMDIDTKVKNWASSSRLAKWTGAPVNVTKLTLISMACWTATWHIMDDVLLCRNGQWYYYIWSLEMDNISQCPHGYKCYVNEIDNNDSIWQDWNGMDSYDKERKWTITMRCQNEQ